MEITDVRVKLINDSGDRLRAVCTVTFDEQFVVRDVKVVDGANGLFVAMPSRKLSSACPRCRHKNHLRAKFCGECGSKLSFQQAPPTDADGRSKLHRDIAHPITAEFRAVIQEKVIAAYEAEYAEAGEPVRRDQEEPERRARDEERPARAEREERAKPEAEAFGAGAFGAETGEAEEPEREEPEREESEPEEATAGATDEYSALIADLRGRSDISGSQERGRERPRGESAGRSDGPGRSEPGDKPRRRRRGGGGGGAGRGRSRDRDDRDRPAPEPVSEAPAEEETVAATAVEPREPERREPEPVVEPEPGFGPGPLDEPETSFGPGPEVEPEPAFGPGPIAEQRKPEPLIEPEEAPADAVSLNEAAAAPATSDDECEDSSPFGMGL